MYVEYLMKYLGVNKFREFISASKPLTIFGTTLYRIYKRGKAEGWFYLYSGNYSQNENTNSQEFQFNFRGGSKAIIFMTCIFKAAA